MNVRLMQVNVKTAGYEFKPENNTQIPYDVFKTLIGESSLSTDENDTELILFKTREEFLETTALLDLGIDKDKPVYVGGAGQIFCFRKGKEQEAKEVDNGTTNTKKD